MNDCPDCQELGREVKRATLESLLRPEHRRTIGDGAYFVCATPRCDTVYFGSDGRTSFGKADLVVRFGLKETTAPRQVCYCFDHTVEGIRGEIARTGQSTVLDSIRADMKGPGCRCEQTNPLGACCLSTVSQVVKDGLRQHGIRTADVSTQSDCWATDDCRHKDLVATGWTFLLFWGLPIVASLLALFVSPMSRTFIWSVALIWAGAGCLINASRCGRLHCYFTGPLFVIGGGAVLLSGLGILPIPASLLAIVIVGGTILALVPEWARGKYVPTASAVVTDDCCAPQPSNRSGALAVSGSVVAAALSSACCWLPLVLLAFGASAAGVAGFLEQWRVPFIAVAAVLLGSGFYFQYWRRPKCDDGSCAVPSKRLRILNQSMLWIASTFVVAMILFPNYVQHLIGGSDAVAVADTPSEGIGLVVPVEGMTCEGCASILTNALGEVAGVSAVDVSYADQRARVTVSPDHEAVRAQIVDAVTSAGYKTRLGDIREHP